jgi:hypothetical protein
MDFLTREVFDLLVILNLIVGLLLAGYRFRQDLTRPIDKTEETNKA